jgi:hypothetical protein
MYSLHLLTLLDLLLRNRSSKIKIYLMLRRLLLLSKMGYCVIEFSEVLFVDLKTVPVYLISMLITYLLVVFINLLKLAKLALLLVIFLPPILLEIISLIKLSIIFYMLLRLAKIFTFHLLLTIIIRLFLLFVKFNLFSFA